jgi:hypothetical protein
MELWCALCIGREARRMATTVTRGWALCASHVAYDQRLHDPRLSEEEFRRLLVGAHADVDC